MSLREALAANGARPNSRYSTLSRFMLDHYDEVHTLKIVERHSWSDIVVALTKMDEFSGASGQALTVEAVKLAWSRTNQRRRLDAARRSNAGQHLQAAVPEPQPRAQSTLPVAQPGPVLPAEMSEIARDGAIRVVGPSTAEIRPARPRETPFPPSSFKSVLNSTTSLLSDDELERRLADLAARQGRGKIPPPEIL
ncbi:MAG: hypothetical protein ACRYG8_29105 [Janthinobacterium lividum]